MQLVRRDIYHQIAPLFHTPESIVITGMRRVGKTTLLQDIYNHIQETNKLFLDLENPLNQKYFEEEDYEKVVTSLATLGVNTGNQSYIFLDEIQLVKNIPQIVKYIMDHYPVKFFLTGSASFYLKNLFSESLAGRKYLFELYPVNFQEFLRFKSTPISIPPQHSDLNEPLHQTISTLYQEYMTFGGFPQVILKNDIKEKRQTLNDIFSSYFQLEVQQLSEFKKLNKLRDLILLLCNRVGSKCDMVKLSNQLGITRQTVNEYIAFLEGTYFIKLITPYSRNRDVEIKKTPKIYVCDSGLINQMARIDQGALFEQSIFQNLRTKGKLNYYQRKTGVEIDFIFEENTAYEIKTTPQLKDLNRLTRISTELNLNTYSLISLNYTRLSQTLYAYEV